MQDLEFRLYQAGIEMIQKHIINDPVALRKWPEYIYSFVTNPLSRKRLRDNYKGGEHDVMMMTLEEWLQEQGNNTTFDKLIELLRERELNDLCDKLLGIVKDIKGAQLHLASTAFSRNTCNPKIFFGMTDVPSFVGRVNDLETLHKLVTENRVVEHYSVALLTSVHGFGGIGKTSLARMYAWKYRNYFDGNVIWIDAEKFSSMQTAFQKVAEKLKVKAVKKTDIDLKDLTESVYNAFANSKCLFIFDNAENFNGQDRVEQFLPSGIIRKPYLLLTSRRKDCFETNRVLPLDILSQSDSIELIKEYIPGATNKVADKLALSLGRLPLAIHQAIAYIRKSLPLYSLNLERDVLEKINSFLEEYKSNSNRILKSEFIGRDGYAKNISSICEMSLRKMELEDGGELAKHMLRYISFLDPDDIQLDFLLKLDYEFESIGNNLQRIKPLSEGTAMYPNMMIDLLCSYSLININIPKMTIKVHRLVQDAMRLMLEQEEELLYVRRLIRCLRKPKFSDRLSHWMSIQRSCKFEASVKHVEYEIPKSIEVFQPVFSLGLNNDLSKKLVEILTIHCTISSVTAILARMTCDNINESVETYLGVYNKIESVLGTMQTINLLLTNYVAFANFIVSDSHKNILQSVFECISILRLRRFPRPFLLNLFGKSFPSEDVDIFLDMLNQSGIDEMFSWYSLKYEKYDTSLLDPTFQIPTSLLNEFPCLNYLKVSSSFTNIDEFQTLNLWWDWRNSDILPLLNNLEFNLEVVRSAIAYIYYADCTIAEYLQKYKTVFEAEEREEYRQPEIIVQIINANYFMGVSSKHYYGLALICCLRSEFDRQKVSYILKVNVCSFYSFYLWKFDDFRIVTRKREEIYFMKSYLQVALRKKVLTSESKTWAVEALHKACAKSRNDFGQGHYEELIKDWYHLMEQEDLKQIAIKANLSLTDL